MLPELPTRIELDRLVGHTTALRGGAATGAIAGFTAANEHVVRWAVDATCGEVSRSSLGRVLPGPENPSIESSVGPV